ncbi:MAG: thioredoxin family protein [Deltaproteobacteria bacterium]|nr:thioredoxin family protein [Deltaproteobacteria bacterium]
MTRALWLALALGMAAPGGLRNFQDTAYAEASLQKKPTVVFVAATWCPVCKAQEAALTELLKQKEFAGVVVLKVDFDDQADVAKRFKASSQSTIIAFKQGQEIGRWVGETNRDRIAIMLKRTL